MFTAIIVDDDEISRSLISEMVQNYFPEIEVTAEAGSFYAGVKEIHKHKPDIVFLDMELPDGKGYEIFDMFFRRPFKVIFITGFRDYAYLAINHSPAGYIIKPVSVRSFANAVHKALPQLAFPLHASDELPKPDPFYSNKIVVKTIEDIHIIPKNKIIRCEACRNYTTIFQEGEKDILASQTLKDFENMLVYPHFLRVHQSHLVNTDFIKRIDKMDCTLILNDNTRVPIAHRKKEQLMEYVRSITA
jgi:two-component system LytT family response regulator